MQKYRKTLAVGSMAVLSTKLCGCEAIYSARKNAVQEFLATKPHNLTSVIGLLGFHQKKLRQRNARRPHLRTQSLYALRSMQDEEIHAQFFRLHLIKLFSQQASLPIAHTFNQDDFERHSQQ